jgi:Kef-type K+ transport system membrane component KefB
VDLSLQILLLIALLILLSKGLGGLSARIGFPLVFGELLAGVILGPTFIDVWHFSWFSSPSTLAGQAVSLPAIFKVFAELGVVILMFLVGMETDLDMLKRAVGPAFWSACGGVLLPLGGGTLAARAAGLGWKEAVFIGTVLTATSVSITAQTLMNLNELRSRPGSTILGAAVIDDVLGLVVLSLVLSAETFSAQGMGQGIGLMLARVTAFLLLAMLAGPRLVRFVLGRVGRFHGPHTPLAVALGIAFVFATAADRLGGMASITGAYLAGLFVAMTPSHTEVVEDLRSMTNSFFGPLFFVSIGLEIDARKVGGHFGFFLALLLVAVVGKLVGCGLGAWIKGFSWRDSAVVGVGMIPRGEVGLITASIGWSAGLISPSVYSLAVLLTLATTLLTPVLLRWVLPSQSESRDSAPLLAEVPPPS